MSERKKTSDWVWVVACVVMVATIYVLSYGPWLAICEHRESRRYSLPDPSGGDTTLIWVVLEGPDPITNLFLISECGVLGVREQFPCFGCSISSTIGRS